MLVSPRFTAGVQSHKKKKINIKRSQSLRAVQGKKVDSLLLQCLRDTSQVLRAGNLAKV